MGEGIPPRSNANRPQDIMLFIATIVWQIYVVVSTYLHASTLNGLFAALHVDPPLLTKLFFLTYRWWFLVPIVFIVLFVLSLRRPQGSPWRSAALIGGSLLAGFAMQAIATEALSGPLLDLIEKVG